MLTWDGNLYPGDIVLYNDGKTSWFILDASPMLSQHKAGGFNFRSDKLIRALLTVRRQPPHANVSEIRDYQFYLCPGHILIRDGQEVDFESCLK